MPESAIRKSVGPPSVRGGSTEIFNALKKVYGSAMKVPEYEAKDDRSADENVAHQFAFIHLRVADEQKNKAKTSVKEFERKLIEFMEIIKD